MKIYFITSKLNFVTAGSSIGEFDLMMRTLQKLGNDVAAVTVFSQINNIPEPLPYQVIAKHVIKRDLIGIQRAVFKILRESARDADWLHIDGHAFLYAAGLYRRLGGQIPISAYFNRELICWPEAEDSHFAENDFFTTLKKKLRWLTEKYIGMFWPTELT